jgi:NitT/TauT family transport system permease protein
MIQNIGVTLRRAAWSLMVPVLFLALWGYLAAYTENEIILPQVSQVFELLSRPSANLIGMGSLTTNILVSLARVMVGYLLAVLIAVPLGLLMGYYGSVFNLLNGFLGLFRPIPPLAWVPLVLAWFGVAGMATVLGIQMGKWYVFLNNLKLSMIFIIFIGAFYPVLTGSIHGVRHVRKTLVESAQVLGATELNIFLKILFPAAAPSIVTGMRTGLGVAWMCLVSAEMLPGSISGVGYLITHAYTVARTDIVIAGMISIGTIGALLDFVFRYIEDKKFARRRGAG